MIDHHEADVVTRARIFWSGIPQASDQANAWSRFFHSRSIRNPQSAIRNQKYYFLASFSLATGAAGFAAPVAAGAASPSSFFSLITSGPAAASATATTGSSSTTGASTENAVRSIGVFAATPLGNWMSRT